jgi:toxin-antitoxin system PIN domain toxin
MIVADLNLILYAHDAGSPLYPKARTWWLDLLSGNEPVGLAEVVLFGFMRLSTHGRIFQQPMTPLEAAGHIRRWLAQPYVQVLTTGSEHVEQVLSLLGSAGTAGNLVTDAQIAAIALDHDATVHSADADFTRFPGLRWHNPITGIKGTNPR